LRINKCDMTTFEGHRAEAFATWRERSAHEWTVDLGDFGGII
jgi:hypothetical protein